MRCESCQGVGMQLVLPLVPGMTLVERLKLLATITRITARHLLWQPCGECGGSGVAHCCDGMRAQPD